MAHPVEGVKESKPRFRAKGKMDELTRQEISKLSRQYLEIRNRGQSSKAAREEMLLAERRDQLIEKGLVERQAAYLLVAFRQKMLGLSNIWARKFIGLDIQDARKLIDEMARSTLSEIAQFPARVTDPNWLAEANGNGSVSPQPQSPALAKRREKAKEAAAVKRRARRRERKEKSGVWT